MSDPIISEDGRWLWNGTEWIPNQPPPPPPQQEQTTSERMMGQVWDEIERIKLMPGSSVINYPDDSKYIGQNQSGMPNGYGASVTPDGGGLIASFIDGVAHEKGILFDEEGIIRMMGNYSDGFLQGPGEEFASDGSHFVGYYANGVRNGEGKESYPNGDVFKGNYKDGVRHGKGVFSMVSGEKFEGNFASGKIISGKEIDGDNSEKQVRFKNGLPTIDSDKSKCSAEACNRLVFRDTPFCYAHQNEVLPTLSSEPIDQIFPAALSCSKDTELNVFAANISVGIKENYKLYTGAINKQKTASALGIAAGIGAGLLAGKILKDMGIGESRDRY